MSYNFERIGFASTVKLIQNTDFGLEKRDYNDNIENDEAYLHLTEEEDRWKQSIKEMMDELGIDYYPSRQEFNKVGQVKMYNVIRDYMGHELLSEQMGLVDSQEKLIREGVFDLMLKHKINYYPPTVFFKMSKQTELLKKIEKRFGHDVLRKRMKLLSQREYEALKKKEVR